MPKKRWSLQFVAPLLCLLALVIPATAGHADPSESPFIVDVWGTEQGLPGSVVISMIQAHDGYLWLGTQHGLVRFDGVHFKVYDEENTPGLNNNQIDYLFEDGHTNLWIGTETAGLTMVNNGRFRHFGTNDSAGKIIYAAQNSSGVWFQTAKGLFSYHDGKMDFHSGVVSPELLLLGEQAVIPSKSGGYWELQNGTVQKKEKNHLIQSFGAYPWGSALVTAACEDKHGNLIVGTHGAGVFWYEPDGKYHQISVAEGLSSPYVLCLCPDHQGNLWVGTDGGGLDRIKRKTFNTPDNLHPWDAQSLAGDAHGGLWAAYNAHGITYWQTNLARDFAIGIASNAWTVLVDHQQRIWAGTRTEGLFRFETDHFQFVPGAEVLGPQISVLFEDHAGQLWVGTPKGLARRDGHGWKLYTTRDGLPGNAVSAIAEDAAGDLWIGTRDSGLARLKDGKFDFYQASPNGLPGNDISCLYVDKRNVLWVGTSGHGLARFRHGKWTRYSRRNGLVSNSISYIIEDGQGNLWIGSNLGLMRIPREVLDHSRSGPMDFSACRIYGKADGLPTSECSGGSQPAACRTRDGRLWFPTTKGVAYVNPADIKRNLQPPQVLIESVQVDNAPETNRLGLPSPVSVTIPPGHNQLEIDYTALNFSAPTAVRFKYRLEGRDSGWTQAGAARSAHFSELPPGDYRFQVQACNEDGVWSKTGGLLALTVQPQFWQTPWFRVVVLVIFLGVIAAVVRYLSTQKLRRQVLTLKQQEALEKERSRIARDLHDQLGANLTQVALLGEMVETDRNSPEDVTSHAEQISQTARETTHALDEIVWAVNPSNDTLDGLVTYACKYAQEYLAMAGLRYRAEVPPQLPAAGIPPEVRHNVFLAFKEAVNNVVKHAQASEVRIRLRLQPDRFILEIEDNGRGISRANSAGNRNGLRNMRRRMEDIRGSFEISAAKEEGTLVRLAAPINMK